MNKGRSYTNRKGERVSVSKEHLDTAIKIKTDLQKASPSRRCSWAKHKRMMEIEGFHDSSSNENYRQMIKQEQDSRGELPSAPKHADMVSDNKLESIKHEIGEISLAKRDAQNNFRELNKLKRELSDGVLLAESVERALKDKEFGRPSAFEPVYVESLPKKDMIAGLSDLHYGAVVDVEGHIYNTEVAKELLDNYANELISIAEDNNVDSIHVVNLGDAVEHLYMRAQNTFSSSHTFSEQITGAADLIIQFLLKLSKFTNVSYTGINGNHDRLNGRKQDSVYSDGAVTVINEIVKVALRHSDVERVEIIDSEPYHHMHSINGRDFLFVHGDKTPMAKKTVLAEQSTLYGVDFDAVISGHFHHHSIKEVGNDKYVAIFGSIKGSDEYTLKTLNTSSRRSQGVLLVDESGEFEIKQVKL